MPEGGNTCVLIDSHQQFPSTPDNTLKIHLVVITNIIDLNHLKF